MRTEHWMSWEGGVDLVAMTDASPSAPNLIVHVARLVQTPAGSAPAGMVLYQPDPAGAPEVIGFVSPDSAVGAYFGPAIFAGTPFEQAPVLAARIEIATALPGSVSARVEVAGRVFEVELSGLGDLCAHHREPGPMPPFAQYALEAVASRAVLKVDGNEVALTLPPAGISGGPPAVWAPAGIYAR